MIAPKRIAHELTFFALFMLVGSCGPNNNGPTAPPTTGPAADFSGTPTSGAASLPVSFTDQSNTGSSPITSWSWSFGDGGSSSAQNPSHTYTSTGTYTVSLTVTTTVSSSTKTRTGYIIVQPSTNPPVCQVSPSDLAFGDQVVSSCTSTQSFTITNIGGGTLTGTVPSSCGQFTVTAGAGPFSLTAGQQHGVSLKFCPTSTGATSCSLPLGGNVTCSAVNCTGTGTSAPTPPVCQVSPSDLAFGDQVVSSCTSTQSFTITNIGGGTLTGTVPSSCGQFTVTAGAGPFSLTAGQQHGVSLKFCPTSTGATSCSLPLGGNVTCSAVNCTGTGTSAPTPPVCQVSPSDLAFGDQVVSSCTSTQSFTITNIGGGTLTGTVPSSCGQFTVTAGAGPFSLTAGQQHGVSLKFCPTSTGATSCSLPLGGNVTCSAVNCTGTGTSLPPCTQGTTASSIDFGSACVGDCSTTMPFNITCSGSGCSGCSGSVSSTSSDFRTVSGGGHYSIASGNSWPVTVQFCPTSSGGRSGTIVTDGGNVGVSGNGCTTPTISSITATGGPHAPASVCFSASVQNGGCSITSFDWDFGDGSAHGSGSAPCHTYQHGGVWTVTLRATNACGTSQSSKQVTLDERAYLEFDCCYDTFDSWTVQTNVPDWTTETLAVYGNGNARIGPLQATMCGKSNWLSLNCGATVGGFIIVGLSGQSAPTFGLPVNMQTGAVHVAIREGATQSNPTGYYGIGSCNHVAYGQISSSCSTYGTYVASTSSCSWDANGLMRLEVGINGQVLSGQVELDDVRYDFDGWYVIPSAPPQPFHVRLTPLPGN